MSGDTLEGAGLAALGIVSAGVLAVLGDGWSLEGRYCR